MPETTKKTQLGDIVREQVHAAQVRLHDFQREAEKTLGELAGRGREARKELDKLVARLEKRGWVDREDLAERARDLGGEIAGHLDEIQDKAIKFVGVASRAQVDSLAREIKRLASKVESLAKDGKRKPKVPQA